MDESVCLCVYVSVFMGGEADSGQAVGCLKMLKSAMGVDSSRKLCMCVGGLKVFVAKIGFFLV